MKITAKDFLGMDVFFVAEKDGKQLGQIEELDLSALEATQRIYEIDINGNYDLTKTKKVVVKLDRLTITPTRVE